MSRLALAVLALALFSVAACVGCSGPDGEKKSSLVTETK
jgi:hypothetical protein